MSRGLLVSEVASRGSAAPRSASPNRETTAAVHSRPKPPRHAGAYVPAPSTVATVSPSRFADAQTVEGTTDNRSAGGRSPVT